MTRHAILPATIALQPAFRLWNRQAIEDEIERLIGLLDAEDGDPDTEDDDPAGDNLDEMGEMEDWRPEGISIARPIFGIDQSLGPVNEAAAVRLWYRERSGL